MIKLKLQQFLLVLLVNLAFGKGMPPSKKGK